LIEAGADVKTADIDEGWTSLMNAALPHGIILAPGQTREYGWRNI